jgi:hypothetical protein
MYVPFLIGLIDIIIVIISKAFGDFIFFNLVFYIVEIIIDCGPKPFANKSCIKKVRNKT